MKCLLCDRVLSASGAPCRCLRYRYENVREVDEARVGSHTVRFALRIDAVDVRVVDMRNGSMGLEATAWVADRDDPSRMIDVKFAASIAITGDASIDRRNVIGRLHRMLVEIVKHEVDEHFVVDGKRLFDPHGGERKVR